MTWILLLRALLTATVALCYAHCDHRACVTPA